MTKYLLIEGELFRRSDTLLNLRYVKETEKDIILTEVYLGKCESNSGGGTLAHKILRQEYYGQL